MGFMNRKASNKKPVSNKRTAEILRRLFTQDAFNVFASVVLSAFLVVLRTIIELTEKGSELTFEIVYKMHGIRRFDEVLEIVLSTLIVWNITGIIQLLTDKQPKNRSRWNTFMLFLLFIGCLFWYILKVYFALSLGAIIVSLILCALLWATLLVYFGHDTQLECTDGIIG